MVFWKIMVVLALILLWAINQNLASIAQHFEKEDKEDDDLRQVFRRM
jgi:hypothetical protein